MCEISSSLYHSMKRMSKFLALFQYHNQLHWPTAPQPNGACPHPKQQSVPDPSYKHLNDIVSTDIKRQTTWKMWWLLLSLIEDNKT